MASAATVRLSGSRAAGAATRQPGEHPATPDLEIAAGGAPPAVTSRGLHGPPWSRLSSGLAVPVRELQGYAQGLREDEQIHQGVECPKPKAPRMAPAPISGLAVLDAGAQQWKRLLLERYCPMTSRRLSESSGRRAVW